MIRTFYKNSYHCKFYNCNVSKTLHTHVNENDKIAENGSFYK